LLLLERHQWQEDLPRLLHGALARQRRGAWDLLVEYTMRLNQSGRFNLPPTRVEALYAPETFGELPNDVVEVQP
jgi:Bacterial Alpha-2-macroglobulin MG10 domain